MDCDELLCELAELVELLDRLDVDELDFELLDFELTELDDD